MRKLLFSILVFAIGGFALAQDLPTNPEPGKCYVRCKTPDVWKNETVTVETQPAYKKIKTYPAQYKTVTEKVLIKEEGEKLVIVPAVYEMKNVEVVVEESSYKLVTVPGQYTKEEVTYTAKEEGSSLKVVPATFRPDSQTIEIKPKTAMWQMSEKAPDCTSSNPDDCRYWCYKPIPAQYTTVDLTKLNADARTEKSTISGYDKTYSKLVQSKKPTTRKVEIPAVTKIVKKRVMVTPPTTKVVKIPAQYATVKKTVLVKDAWAEEVTIPAKFKTVTKEVLVKKGGLTTWTEVDCKLVTYNPLPIRWRSGSATLTPAAKKIIDDKLLPVIKDGVTIELASHTDSRGNKTKNRELSERRAQAVVNYLMSKGINASQLVAKGYGESRLTNRCADGVTCTEREHQQNRRTEFRVINR